MNHDKNFLSQELIEQIQYAMDKCSGRAHLVAILEPDCELSAGVREFLEEFLEATDNVSIEIYDKDEDILLQSQIASPFYPVIAIMDESGGYSGASFNGIPLGNELESFVLAIYNVAGPGQSVCSELLQKIKALRPMNLKIGVSLSCPMCSDVVKACQRIAVLNSEITAAMIDLQHYPDLRKKHNIMSVPALIVDDKSILFGKKSLEEVVDYLAKN